jgi:hypothetical protein
MTPPQRPAEAHRETAQLLLEAEPAMACDGIGNGPARSARRQAALSAGVMLALNMIACRVSSAGLSMAAAELSAPAAENSGDPSEAVSGAVSSTVRRPVWLTRG